MAIADKCYGPAHATSIEKAQGWRYFLARVARYNRKQKQKLHRTFRSKAKKWKKYYSSGGDNASFTFYAHADPARVAKKATLLQQLGAEVSFEEETTDNG